jgi:hypothetical protein
MFQAVIPIRRLLLSRPGERCRGCQVKHKTWLAVACCRWRVTRWPIMGCPPPDGLCYVMLAECGGPPAVSLWPSLEEAERAFGRIAAAGCGPGCQRDRHGLFVLVGAEQ